MQLTHTYKQIHEWACSFSESLHILDIWYARSQFPYNFLHKELLFLSIPLNNVSVLCVRCLFKKSSSSIATVKMGTCCCYRTGCRCRGALCPFSACTMVIQKDSVLKEHYTGCLEWRTSDTTKSVQLSAECVARVHTLLEKSQLMRI